jgi:hypothetical protein
MIDKLHRPYFWELPSTCVRGEPGIYFAFLIGIKISFEGTQDAMGFTSPSKDSGAVRA